jgi:hypothetical protein
MHTFLHYEKQLLNLQLQEGRLRRQHEKDIAELRQLQQDRLANEQPAAATAAAGMAPDSKIGFDFSTGTAASYIAPVAAISAPHNPILDTEPRPAGSGAYA